jgi:hypothetical protein
MVFLLYLYGNYFLARRKENRIMDKGTLEEKFC